MARDGDDERQRFVDSSRSGRRSRDENSVLVARRRCRRCDACPRAVACAGAEARSAARARGRSEARDGGARRAARERAERLGSPAWLAASKPRAER